MRNGFLVAVVGACLAAAPAAAAAPVFVAVDQLPGGTDVMDLSAADVNSDGRKDVLFTGWRGGMTVSLARRGGGLDVRGPFSVGEAPTRPLVIDIDGDGRRDVITARRFGGSVTVLRGTASEGFQRADFMGPPAREDVNEFGRAEAVAAADVTGDDRLDLVIASSRLNALFVLAQTDTGFAAPVEHASDAAFDIDAGDVTGDGRADLVLATRGAIKVLAARPGGGLGTPVAHPVARPSAEGWRVVVRDVDGDGRDDVLSGGGTVLRGLAGGGLELWGDVDMGRVLDASFDDDLDGDGALDLAGVTGADGVLTGFLGTGFGSWTQGFGARVNAEELAVADYDDDGRPDLFVIDHWAHSVVRVLANQTPRVVLGDLTAGWSHLELRYAGRFRSVHHLRVELKRPGQSAFSPAITVPRDGGVMRFDESMRLAEGEWRVRVSALNELDQAVETVERATTVEHVADPGSGGDPFALTGGGPDASGARASEPLRRVATLRTSARRSGRRVVVTVRGPARATGRVVVKLGRHVVTRSLERGAVTVRVLLRRGERPTRVAVHYAGDARFTPAQRTVKVRSAR